MVSVSVRPKEIEDGDDEVAGEENDVKCACTFVVWPLAGKRR